MKHAVHSIGSYMRLNPKLEAPQRDGASLWGKAVKLGPKDLHPSRLKRRGREVKDSPLQSVLVESAAVPRNVSPFNFTIGNHRFIKRSRQNQLSEN